MTILLDNCVRARLKAHFRGHDVVHAQDLGWERLRNGELLREADRRFEVMVTVDKNMRFQSNLTGKRLRVAVLDVRGNDYQQLIEADRTLLPMLERLPEGQFTVIQPQPSG